MNSGILPSLLGTTAATMKGAEAAPVKIEKIRYSHYGNCYMLTNGIVEVIVTADVGPRIISYKFVGKENILAEFGPERVVKTELGEWHPWGGHRLWHSPEAMPRSYSPDNTTVEVEIIGKSTLRVAPATEFATHIRKEIYISLEREGTEITVTHVLRNKGMWPVELAPWALTIMNGGGISIIPQEPFIPSSEKLLPARSLTLWNYTDMSDPRWTFGRKYIRLRSDENLAQPQKIGTANKQGWAAYLREETLFVKRFPYVEDAKYPDYGCNFETYTAGNFIEVESLGPLAKLEPNVSTTYVEHWYLFDGVTAENTDESIDAKILPLVQSTAKL